MNNPNKISKSMFVILGSILFIGDEADASSIVTTSEDVYNTVLSTSTVFKGLKQLTELGLIKAEWEDPENIKGRGRPRRRFYYLVGAGYRVFEAERIKYETFGKLPCPVRI